MRCAVGGAAAFIVLLFSALDWAGWATGIQLLTRVYPTWPQMTPWTALWLAALAVAVVVQSGTLGRAGSVGRGLALARCRGHTRTAEYAMRRLFGIDQLWFGDSVRALQSSWPGRPSPQTAISAVLLSVTVGVIAVDESVGKARRGR